MIIIFDEKESKPEKYDGEFRLYEIPKDGVLRTQFKQQSGFIAPVKLKYYYIGGREELTYLERTAGAIDNGKPQVFSKEISEGTVRYLVGYLSEGDQYFNQLRKKIDELFPPEVQ